MGWVFMLIWVVIMTAGLWAVTLVPTVVATFMGYGVLAILALGLPCLGVLAWIASGMRS